MDFIDKNIQQYAELHTSHEPTYLYDLNRYTHTNVLQPRMLSGHLQGRFLSFISCLIKPQYILDIGTYTGYSALCLAEGLEGENAQVISLELDEEVAHIAQQFIEKSPYAKKINVMVGNALEFINKVNDRVPYWDLIWIDAEKMEYTAYYEACIDKVRKGGIILADNVLWSGKVINDKALLEDEETAAIHQFNTMIQNDKRVKNILLPLRDGIMAIEKL
jgi:caffeoyl-CoA O-methyltransferase